MTRAQRKKEGKKQPHTPKARAVVEGVNNVGRSRSAHLSHRWNFIKKAKARQEEVKLEKPKKAPAAAKKKVEPKWYAADDASKPIPSRKHNHRPTRLRKSITPGTVLVILAGRFQGKRVVFLRQLASGLLLVTGPYKYNGVPLRRVNQAYVISTSTKLDVSGIDTKAITDAFFAKREEDGKNEKKGEFLKEAEKKKVDLPAARKAEQKRVDTLLIAVVKKTPLLAQYIKAKFSLKKGQYPHAIRF